MKDKINIKQNELDAFNAYADLANVKIISETKMGEESIFIVRFRQPAALFTLGRYLQKSLSEKTPIVKPKIKKVT